MTSSSSSPRSRIDQFFPSRKRKPSSLKDEKADKDSKSSLDVSPNAKGTLEGYLVKSPDARSPVTRPDSGSSTPSRHGLAKRNLTRDIGLAPDCDGKPVCLSNNVGGNAAGVTTSVLALENSRSAIHTGENSAVQVASDAVEPGVGTSELKRFATDFLSLYCSELPSAESLPSEENLKGQKRNGSPSLLVGNTKTCSKKHRVVDQANFSAEPGKLTPDQKHSEDRSSQVASEFREAVVATTTAPIGIANDAVMEGDGKCDTLPLLRRCNSNSNLIKTGSLTPGSSVRVFSTHETPKSACRNSIISPGEEFWNEAIQVADCLLAPADKSSVLVFKGFAAKNKEGPVKSCFPEDGRFSNILAADKLSTGIPPHDDTKSSNLTENACNPDQMEDSVFIEKTEGCAEESSKSTKNCIEASPLPVKHLDFSQEDHIMHENKSDKRTSPGNIDESSSNETTERPQNSSLLSLTPVKAPKDTSNFAADVIKGERIHNGNQQSSDRIMQCGVSGNVLSSVEKEVKHRLGNHGRNNEVTTPSSSVPLKQSLQLTNWLPSEICNIYMKKGISKLYAWQVDCLQVDGVLERRNLVYCASTSAGKSFVAEILMLRRVISTGKIAILVLPYVSICAEKAEHLEELLEPLGKHVRSFYGNQGGGSLPKDTSVAVCTIEKANSLINRLLEEGRLSEVGIIVIDELHMVGDQHRGYLLELMLTKLRYASGDGSIQSSSGESSGSSSGKTDLTQGLQVVGMSATMPNVSAVADWLQAALYQTEFRPVPLEEYIKVGSTIFNKKMDRVRTIPKTFDLGGKDPDHVVELCNEVVKEGHSVLLFCSSRKGCESTARHISKFLVKFLITSRVNNSELTDALSAIEALRKSPAGLDPILEDTIPSGVAYHHAGLTVEEREIVESCYRKGIIRVLTATSTLAAGVNLPARRVIFRQPRIGRDFIDGTRYRQMAGRAGRTGIDTKGESILICKPDEVKRITAVLNDSCPPLQSCLSDDKNGMTHAILEVVAGGIVQTANDIHRYVRCTLLNSTKPFQDVVKSAQDSLRWLCHNKFLEWNTETNLYSTTPLGRAAFGSSLSPEESLVVLDDLSRAREGFVLASDLHLVYLVTPINVEIEPDWELYYERFMELSVLDQSVGNRVGVVEPFLMRMAHGAPTRIPDNTRGKNNLLARLQSRGAAGRTSCFPDRQTLRVSKRFYVALMLSKLVQEVPLADVCDAFKVARGMIQSLQDNAGRFASMVSQFCERLGWHDLEGLISKFQNRVSFGVRAEIVELTTIPHVKGSRARALYKAGLRTPLAIAESSIRDIANALFGTSSWTAEGSSAVKRMQLGVSKKIKNGARKIVLDKAEEAREAAFSAFRSLGVHVPHFSVSLQSNEEGSLAIKGDAVLSHCEGPKACSAKKDAQQEEKFFSVRPTLQDRKAGEDVYFENGKDILKDKEFKSNAPGEVGLSEEMQGNSRLISASVLVQCSSLTVVPSVNAAKGGSANFAAPICAKLIDEGGSRTLLDGGQMCNENHGDDGGHTSYSNSGTISDGGPINAGKMPGGFDSFLDEWEAIGEFYFDAHFSKRTTHNFPVLFEIFGLAICWKDSPIYYITLPKDLISSCPQNQWRHSSQNSADHKIILSAQTDPWEKAEQRWNRISKIMGQKGVRKITWNLKSQIQVLKFSGISIQRFCGIRYEQEELKNFKVIDSTHLSLPSISVHDGVDVCLLIWILWPDEESCSTPNLDKVVKKRLSPEAAAAANRVSRWKNQMRKVAHNGCCRRAAQIRALTSVLWRLLISENLVDALTRIENPLVRVLADMELWGIGVDLEGCFRARHVLGKKLKELEKEAFKLAGVSFSLYSTVDVANILYTHLKLPVPEGCNKGKQHPSTNKHSLDLLRGQHPIIPVIKEHRILSKLLNSTLGSICSKAQLCLKSQKYLINGHWLQTSTATGRLSMEEPNLQCVEHTIEFSLSDFVKSDHSSSDVVSHRINARDFFIATQDNWVLLTADYSQIEFRLMAHFSRDASLIELLSKPDGDVFTMLAASWMKKLECSVTTSERDHTKKLVYGILYGMGANTLAEQLECQLEEAKEKIQSFKASFSGVSAWLQEAVAFCRRKGYVETLMGRKRFLSKIKFGNSKEKSKAQRQAVNSICQGSAADIIKIAMVNIHSVLAEDFEVNEMPNTVIGVGAEHSMLKGRCRILLQVHDELLLEVDPSLVKEAGLLLQSCMETAASLLVPLQVKLKVGRTWGSLEPFDPKS